MSWVHVKQSVFVEWQRFAEHDGRHNDDENSDDIELHLCAAIHNSLSSVN